MGFFIFVRSVARYGTTSHTMRYCTLSCHGSQSFVSWTFRLVLPGYRYNRYQQGIQYYKLQVLASNCTLLVIFPCLRFTNTFSNFLNLSTCNTFNLPLADCQLSHSLIMFNVRVFYNVKISKKKHEAPV